MGGSDGQDSHEMGLSAYALGLSGSGDQALLPIYCNITEDMLKQDQGTEGEEC